MACDEFLAGRIRDELLKTTGITEKRMFGGVCFLLHGNLLVGVWKDSLIARVGIEASLAALTEPHVHPMDITGKPMKGWLIIDAGGIRTDRSLRLWIKRSITFVAGLPPKPPVPPRRLK